MADIPSHDAIVIGGGPAGLSAAIALGRARRSVLVVDRTLPGRSDYPQVNWNFFGFPQGVPVRELVALGRKQAERFGATVLDADARSARRTLDGFVVDTSEGPHGCRGLVLATGVRDDWPRFPGFEACIGHSLHWCITCDGFEMEGQRVAVVGNDDDAAETALQLQRMCLTVSMITNDGAVGLSPAVADRLTRRRIPLLAGRIASARTGDGGTLAGVTLEDGTEVAVDHLFSQQGAAPQTALARSLGVALDGHGYVLADTEGRTSEAMVFAAGDCTRLYNHQVSAAVHEGATAAAALIYDLFRMEEWG